MVSQLVADKFEFRFVQKLCRAVLSRFPASGTAHGFTELLPLTHYICSAEHSEKQFSRQSSR